LPNDSASLIELQYPDIRFVRAFTGSIERYGFSSDNVFRIPGFPDVKGNIFILPTIGLLPSNAAQIIKLTKESKSL